MSHRHASIQTTLRYVRDDDRVTRRCSRCPHCGMYAATFVAAAEDGRARYRCHGRGCGAWHVRAMPGPVSR